MIWRGFESSSRGKGGSTGREREHEQAADELASQSPLAVPQARVALFGQL
jgi:hypothetical protein